MFLSSYIQIFRRTAMMPRKRREIESQQRAEMRRFNEAKLSLLKFFLYVVILVVIAGAITLWAVKKAEASKVMQR